MITLAALLTCFAVGYLATVLRDPYRGFLVLLPFMVVTRSVELPIVGERITAFDVLLLIWWLGIVLRRLAGHRDLHLSPVILAPALAYWGFLGATVLSLLHAPDIVKGIVEIAVYAFAGLWGLTVVSVCTSWARVVTVVRWTIWSVLGVILVSGAEAVLGPLGLFPTRGHGIRLSGPFRQTNQLAAYLRATAPLVWGALLLRRTSRWQRWGLAGVVVGGVGVLILTSSRFNILVTVAELALFMFVVLRLRHHGRVSLSWRAVVLVSLLAVAAVLMVPQVAPEYWQTFMWRALPFFKGLLALPSGGDLLGTLPVSQAEFATHNWSLAWQAFLDSPIWGVGIGNFGQQYQIISGVVGTEVHSLYAGLLAETGILGLGFVLVLFAILAARGWRLLRAAHPRAWPTVGLVISYVGWLVAGIYIPFLRTREFWLTAGLLLASTACRFSIAGPGNEDRNHNGAL